MSGAPVPKVATRGTEFPDRVRMSVFRRCSGICEMPDCSVKGTEYHHRLRKSQGGPGVEENCLLLCQFHHGWVHANPAASYERGWLLHSWDREALTE